MPAFLADRGSGGWRAVQARPQADPAGVCLDGSPRRSRPSPQKGGPKDLRRQGAHPGARREDAWEAGGASNRRMHRLRALSGAVLPGSGEPGRGGGRRALDGGAHGAARAGEGEGREIAKRPLPARRRRAARSACAQAREGSQANPHRAKPEELSGEPGRRRRTRPMAFKAQRPGLPRRTQKRSTLQPAVGLRSLPSGETDR